MAVGARDDDVVERPVRVKAEALRDLLDALGPEVALGVDEDALALPAARVVAQLQRHTKEKKEKCERPEMMMIWHDPTRSFRTCEVTARVCASCVLPVRNLSAADRISAWRCRCQRLEGLNSLSVRLGDAPSLDAAAEDRVEGLATRGHLDAPLAPLANLLSQAKIRSEWA
jgi:hypothetical protein